MKILPMITAASVVVAITTVAALAQPNTGKFKLVLKEHSLGKVPPMAVGGKPLVSPDNRHVAYAVMRGGKYCVSRDGVEGKPYAKVEGLTFSPDGKQLAFAAKKAFGRNVVVVDGEETKEYESLDGASLTFSPDSKRLAFVASPFASPNLFVVLDGKAGVEYTGFSGAGPGNPQLFFSPDSRKLAYGAVRKTAGDKEEYEVVIEGADRKVFTASGGAIVDGFSSDSQHLGWSVEHAGNWQVVIDGTSGQEYDEIGHDSFHFSSDGKRWAYVAKRGAKWMVVDNDHESPGYDAIGTLAPVFSADGRRLAYVATHGEKRLVVVNGQEGAEYDGVAEGSLQFSPDGQHVAFIGVRGRQHFAVRDGKEGEPYDGSREAIFFSPDSQHLAYVADRGGAVRFVLDGKERSEYEAIADNWACFSPDSKVLVYGASRDRKLVIVVDDQEIGAYQGHWGTLTFEKANLLCGVATRMDAKFDVELLRLEIEITPR